MNASMTQGPNVADHRTHSPKGGGAKGRRCEVGTSPWKSWRLEGCISKSKASSPEKPLTFWRVGDLCHGLEKRAEEKRGEERRRRRKEVGGTDVCIRLEREPNKHTTNSEWEKYFPCLNQTHFLT